MACVEDGELAMTEGRDASLQAIEAWVACDLAARYNGALSEPLPAELLALLQE